MTSIGLTGNIASGKSHIAEIFASLGVAVQDADKIAHAVLENEAKAEIEKEFGTSDRKELASIVFTDYNELKKLESILHPLVRKRNLAFIKQHELSLIEIPLLFETKAEEIFDYVVYIDISPKTQLERALQRPNMTREKLEHILKRQHKILPEVKKSRADFIIDNNPGANIIAQIKNILGEICAK